MPEMSGFLQWIVDFVKELGYLGIFIMTFVESTFVPIPAEVTMVPAGYLVYQGEMDFSLVMISAISGAIGGSLFNYWIAYHYGRMLFIKYGRYFFMNEKKLEKIETFFLEHGAFSTFTGRLLPGVRHYISFPAGLARMNLRLFIIFTGIGSAIWLAILLGLGYFIGHEQSMIKAYLPKIVIGLVLTMACAVYVYLRRRRSRSSS